MINWSIINSENFKLLIYQLTLDTLRKNNFVADDSTDSSLVLKEIKSKKKVLLKISRKKDELINY